MYRCIDSNLKCASGEFNADSKLRLQTKLVASESGEEVGFADAGIADQNYLEQVIVLLVRSSRHLSGPFGLVTVFFLFLPEKRKENLRSPRKSPERESLSGQSE